MRLLERNSAGEVYLTEDFLDDKVPPYAILSHTWGAEEVSFKALMDGTGKNKLGYDKIRFCGDQAWRDGLRFFWLDTCCIDKSNNTELQEAINSMFRWYQNAAKCYVYLADVATPTLDADASSEPLWESAFRKSRWFTRGWTLQELIAPASVEFFSKEGVHLGNKSSLEQHIHDVTGIPLKALRGSPLSDFAVPERLAWIEKRETTRKEDKAYSLLGLFDVQMPLIYGEGEKNAFRRLGEEINKASQSEQTHDQKEDRCLADLRSTDPRHDKIRIQDTKGGLLRDSYRWVIDNAEFQRWRNDEHSRLLWIKGDPGKGKTMLLCGIIDELSPSTRLAGPEAGPLLSYFFCQATDSRINSAMAVLRGLIYLLVSQQPSLISYIRTKYDHAGNRLFEDANAWVAVSEIFTEMLRDANLQNTYLIIDAVDECTIGLNRLLDLVIQISSAFSRVKWIISSRNWPDIEEQLDTAKYKVGLYLELNEKSISTAVSKYIHYKVDRLAQLKKYDSNTRDIVQRHLSSNANDTFLWVALVCQDLEKIPRRKVLDKLNAFPPGLGSLYERMVDQTCHSEDVDLCKQILAIVSTVYRPITLDELTCFVETLKDLAGDDESLVEIIGRCGSFLTLRDRTVYFIHQSAKDFLSKKAFGSFFSCAAEQVHHDIFSRSLNSLSQTLRRDIYMLKHPGHPIDQVEKPKLDPLVAVRYSCVYWADHLCDCNPTKNAINDLQDGGSIDKFLRRSYLYWLEALAILRSIPNGVLSMAKLEHLLQQNAPGSDLRPLVRDARRFILYFKLAIEISPLQIYISALIFSPARCLMRRLFEQDEPGWIPIKPPVEDDWSPCLHTFEGHADPVSSVAFSLDGTQLASASAGKTVKLWDTVTGHCLQTFEGHSGSVPSVAFSPDGTQLASASSDKTVKLWDIAMGRCLQTFVGHSDWVSSVAFSPDGTQLVSASNDTTSRLWDRATGHCLQTFEGHSGWAWSTAFSPDGTQLVSASHDRTIRLWDIATGHCIRTFESHRDRPLSVAFSPDGTQLVSASDGKTVRLWDITTGDHLQAFEGHKDRVQSVAFSSDGTQLASASSDKTVKLWDTATGHCLQTFEGHSSSVRSVTFSSSGIQLASASADKTVRLWDIVTGYYSQTFESHMDIVRSIAFSPDSTQVASASYDKTVRLWDLATGHHLQTFKDHRDRVISVAFSPDGTQLASTSYDKTVRLWDISIGVCLHTFEGHTHHVRSVTFSLDGIHLASASADKTVRLWNATIDHCLQTFEGHGDWVQSVTFSPDGTQLASASYDKTIKLWDTATGHCLQTFGGHAKAFCSVAFSPDGTQLASASSDKTVRLWDIATRRCLQTLGTSQTIYALSFDATGSCLHTDVGTLRLNELSTSKKASNQTIQKPRRHGYGVSSDNVWITYNSKNLIWLPPEYRPVCSAVAMDSTVVLGCSSGRVLIFQFSRQGFQAVIDGDDK